MRKKIKIKIWTFLTVFAFAVSMGMNPVPVFAEEPEVGLVEGYIAELNMRSGYMIMGEKKILFDSETTVQNQNEEPLSIKALREGFPASVFFEKRKFSNKALLITLHPNHLQSPE